MFSRSRPSESAPLPQQERPHSFQEILKQARQGEGEGLSLQYRRFLPGIFGYIASCVPDRATAEDLTSDVFLAMVEGIERQRYDEEARFTAWLFRIARTTVAACYRKHEKQHPAVPFDGAALGGDYADIESIPDEQMDADPIQWAETRDEWNNVVQAMNQLTEEQRQVLVGRFLLGYDVATVAKQEQTHSDANASTSSVRCFLEDDLWETIFQGKSTPQRYRQDELIALGSLARPNPQ